MSRLCKKSICVAACALGCLGSISAAIAQPPPAEDVQTAGEGEVIVVTGSAIERTETTTPAPVTVLDREELEAAGQASIGDILQDIPAQSNGVNTQANNGGTGATRMSMRGLGDNRTLVLVNGRRHVPGGTGADASVDLSVIPLAVVERVEILKDGASAIYGADAIGGVVNVITRSNVNGAEVNLYTATTQRGDGTTYDVSVLTGTSSSRSNILFQAGFYDQADIFARDRAFSAHQRDRDFATGEVTENGSSITPEGTIFDRVCGPKENPRDHGCAADRAQLLCRDGDADTTTSRVCFRDPTTGEWRTLRNTGTSDAGTGDLWNFQTYNYLRMPQRRYNAFTSGHYEFHDNVRGFFEASYVNRQSDQRLAPEPLTTGPEGILVSADNVHNPWRGPEGRAFEGVAKRMVETGPRTFAQDVDTFRVVAGVDGRLPDRWLSGWKYELSYNFGRTLSTQVNEGNLIRPNVIEALGPSYRDENGVARCGTPEEPGTPGCVPLDLFGGVGSITDEMVDWISYTGVARGFNRQHTVLAQLSGPLFETPWDGNVRLSAGGDYRYEAGGLRPDPLTATGNTTGATIEPIAGSYYVTEGFAELSVLPVTDRDWVKWLELSGAARVVDYSTFGTNFSWKAGVLYKLPIGVAARGTYSTAFRAPNVAELYGGTADFLAFTEDPCDTSGGPLSAVVAENCRQHGVPDDFQDPSGVVSELTGGNEELQPETARVVTAGVIYEPTFAEGFAATVDYYDIRVEDPVQTAGVDIILRNCYTAADRSSCDKIARAASGHIRSVDNRLTNIGRAETSGIDVGVAYRHELPGVGRFRYELDGTRLLKFDNVFPDGSGGEIRRKGAGVYDLGPNPKYKVNLSTSWSRRGLAAGFNMRYIHSLRECRSADEQIQNDCSVDGVLSRKIAANVTADVLASYEFANPVGRTVIGGGVNNVLDQDPSDVYNGFAATSDSGTYDFIGRFLYLRVHQEF